MRYNRLLEEQEDAENDPWEQQSRMMNEVPKPRHATSCASDAKRGAGALAGRKLGSAASTHLSLLADDRPSLLDAPQLYAKAQQIRAA
jgi:hypothetical protein